MRFLEWLQLNEAGNFRFEHPTKIGDRAVSHIDMRAEDWELQPRPLRHPEEQAWHNAIHLKKIFPAAQFASMPSFYGRTPEGTYIYHRKGDVGIVTLMSSKPKDEAAINLNELPLKRNWWDYAEFVSAGKDFTPGGNVRIKPPHRARATEQTPLDIPTDRLTVT